MILYRTPFIDSAKLDHEFTAHHRKVVENMKKVKDLKIIQKQVKQYKDHSQSPKKSMNHSTIAAKTSEE